MSTADPSLDDLNLPDDLAPYTAFRAAYQDFRVNARGEGLVTFLVPVPDKARALAVSDLAGGLGLVQFAARQRVASPFEVDGRPGLEG